MSIYTLPTYDNLWKDKKLKAIEKKENICCCTDLALALGASPIVKSNNFCDYYTQTKSFLPFDQIIVCNALGNPTLSRTNDSQIVIRPVIEKDPISEDYTYNEEEDLLYVQSGEYPQSTTSEITYLKLEKAFIYGEIQKTDKKYTMYYAEKHTRYFLDKIMVQEYIFENEKYVRLIANPAYDQVTLSNGATIKKGTIIWIKVEPIVWLYEKNKKVGIAEKGLIAGVPYNKNPYDPYYYGSFAENYLNNIFSKDLIPSKSIQKVKKFN